MAILKSEYEEIIGELETQEHIRSRRLEDYDFLQENFQNMRGSVYYPGCGPDLTPIFALSNCSRFVYQDIGEWYFKPDTTIRKAFFSAFRNLSDNHYIRNLEFRQGFPYRGNLRLYFQIANPSSDEQDPDKELILYYGKRKGDMCRTVPKEIGEVKFVFLNGMHLDPLLVPFLNSGTIIRSSTTIGSNGNYFCPLHNSQIRDIGLEIIDLDKGIFRKK